MRVSGSVFSVQCSVFRVQGFRRQVSGLRVSGLAFRVQVSGLGVMVSGPGFRILVPGIGFQGVGFRVQGSGYRVQGLESKIQGSGYTPNLHTRTPVFAVPEIGERTRHPPKTSIYEAGTNHRIFLAEGCDEPISPGTRRVRDLSRCNPKTRY